MAALAHDLLAAGMDVMRINCAHDDPEVWAAMADNLRQAQQKLGRELTCAARSLRRRVYG
jgi:pyruvate kinase